MDMAYRKNTQKPIKGGWARSPPRPLYLPREINNDKLYDQMEQIMNRRSVR